MMKQLFPLIMMTLSAIGATAQPTRTIFITGGDFSPVFIKYVAALTKKSEPKICYIPTASADNIYSISYWYELCSQLPVKPYVLRTFINAAPGQKTFEETIMSMDAIVVGGGSTLNMMAIWRAQGIDTVLRKAYDHGIVMAGGSAGSLCWFNAGPTDSRPIHLTFVDCLGFIKTSHCPHYHSEPTRKPIYQQAILNGTLGPGYACDDRAGILFENEKLVKCVASDDTSHAYFLSLADGKIKEDQLPNEVLH
jgi:dipeptidase E